MSDGFGDGEEPMHVVSVGEQRARNLPGGAAVVRKKPKYLSLTLAHRAQVACEEFFKVANRLTVSAKHKRRRQAPHASQAYQILGQRLETTSGIDGIRREDGIRRDSLEHAIAGDDCTIGVAHERARARRVSRCMN